MPTRVAIGCVMMMWMIGSSILGCSRPSDAVGRRGTHVGAADVPDGSEAAVFGGGCFWCVEAALEQLDGVTDVVSGYAGGSKATADYKTVSSGATDHAEVVRVVYDPDKIGYARLLKAFFVAHDPTQLDRQGPDAGRQYRSAVFYADDAQKQAAEAFIRRLNESGALTGPVVTTLEPLEAFYPAEDYHQDYARKNPNHPYVRAHSLPKAKKVRAALAATTRGGS